MEREIRRRARAAPPPDRRRPGAQRGPARRRDGARASALDRQSPHARAPAQGARRAPDADEHPLFIDLLAALETTKVDTWRSAHESVRDEALGRLHEYYCSTLDADHRAAFDACVASLEAQVVKDAQAIKAGAGSAAAMTAERNAERMFDHFTAGMREVATTACAAPARRAA